MEDQIIDWFSSKAEVEYTEDPDNFTNVNGRIFHYTGQYVGRIIPAVIKEA